MQWLQTRYSEGQYRRSRRFKCNLCGITQEIPASSITELPDGWQTSVHQGWHACPGCGQKKRAALPLA